MFQIMINRILKKKENSQRVLVAILDLKGKSHSLLYYMFTLIITVVQEY